MTYLCLVFSKTMMIYEYLDPEFSVIQVILFILQVRWREDNIVIVQQNNSL